MTISDACAILNERQPCKPSHARRCVECESDDLAWVEEESTITNDPYAATGRDIEVCNECGAPTGKGAVCGRVVA